MLHNSSIMHYVIRNLPPPQYIYGHLNCPPQTAAARNLLSIRVRFSTGIMLWKYRSLVLQSFVGFFTFILRIILYRHFCNQIMFPATLHSHVAIWP